MLRNSLGGQAYSVVGALSVRIGPRPAGSAEEKRAINYVSLELEAICDQVRQLPVTGIPSAFPPQIILLAGAASLAYCVSELVESPWSMFVFLVAFAVVPRALSVIRQRASADSDRSSANVLGVQRASGKQICYVRGAHLLPPRFTDRGLNALLREANPAIRAHYYWMGNSDFDSFLAKGFRAASVCVRGDARSEEVYHTERDTLDHVSADTLQLVVATVERTVRLLDEHLAIDEC